MATQASGPRRRASRCPCTVLVAALAGRLAKRSIIRSGLQGAASSASLRGAAAIRSRAVEEGGIGAAGVSVGAAVADTGGDTASVDPWAAGITHLLPSLRIFKCHNIKQLKLKILQERQAHALEDDLINPVLANMVKKAVDLKLVSKRANKSTLKV